MDPKPKIVAIHQPCYLPWLGYLHKIWFSDVFVLHDNVQYTKKSFIKRVLIRKPHSAGESDYLILPLKQHSDFDLIKDIRVDNSQDWRRKHLVKMTEAYRGAPHFGRYFPAIERMFGETAGMESLTDVIEKGIRLLMELLECRTRLVRSSALPVGGQKSEYNLNLVKQFDGKVYYSGSVAVGYQSDEEYRAAGVALLYSTIHAYVREHPYSQPQGEFINGLSSVDALFNIGAEGIRALFADYETGLRSALASGQPS